MAITYHAGRRIQATQADFDGTPAVQAGWKQVGKVTLGSSADQMEISSIPDKRYYMVLTHILDSGQADVRYRFGSSGTIDTNTNYAFRRWDNGSASTSHTTSSLNMTGDQADDDKFHVMFASNLLNRNKLFEILYAERGDNLGSGYVPRASKGIGKWTENNPLDTIRVYDAQTGSYNSGSEMVILGWDPEDTHTDNFWEELANVNLSGGAASNLSSGTISAKKYLWVQYYAQTSTNADIKFTFNNSTSGYCDMRQINDSSYSGKINEDNWEDEGGLSANQGIFVNMFIINNANSVKLGIVNSVRDVGGSAGTQPQKRHWVGKWTETTNQITEIDLTASTGNLQSVSELRVWGADPV